MQSCYLPPFSFPSDCTNSAQRAHQLPPHVTTVYYYLPLDTFYWTLKRFLVRLVCVPALCCCQWNAISKRAEESKYLFDIIDFMEMKGAIWTQPTVYEWDISPTEKSSDWFFINSNLVFLFRSEMISRRKTSFMFLVLRSFRFCLWNTFSNTYRINLNLKTKKAEL